ncbi:response regulator [Galbibacter sp. EGI 63066]|uniref:response regulator n=1 Tax=Galbibacter sp. EGI 63066 TaxID=2993559 RepID=UPI0022491EEC|nr:response regulator [Galbibacter sp. EGI 63066]MCX2678494.1 response regulator [Galbibacter sp. EGI 63066]
MKKTINVLIVDDHPLIIKAYTQILNSISGKEGLYDFNVKSATNIPDAVKLIDNQKFSSKLDLVFLDISMPKCYTMNMTSGEDLGIYIKSEILGINIIVITLLDDNYRLINIIRKLNPNGLLLKSDVDSDCFLYAVKRIMEGHIFYSASVDHLLNKRIKQNFIIDDIDTQLLIELSNGAKMKDLEALLPLTKSGINKRKNLLRYKLDISGNSDRDLVLSAKEKGFI